MTIPFVCFFSWRCRIVEVWKYPLLVTLWIISINYRLLFYCVTATSRKVSKIINFHQIHRLLMNSDSNQKSRETNKTQAHDQFYKSCVADKNLLDFCQCHCRNYFIYFTNIFLNTWLNYRYDAFHTNHSCISL